MKQLVRLSRFPLTVLAGLLLSGSTAVALSSAAFAQTSLSASSVRACLDKIHTSNLTLAQATACAPGSPVFTMANPPTGAVPSIFIMVRDANHAVVNFSAGDTSTVRTRVQTASGAQLVSTASGCWNQWRYPSTSFGWGYAWGSIWAAGYGNHCGYSNVPSNPTFSYGCTCSNETQSLGHYDSRYGSYAFGQNYAAGWVNATFSGIVGGPLVDTVYCRAYVDPNANSWAWCS